MMTSTRHECQKQWEALYHLAIEQNNYQADTAQLQIIGEFARIEHELLQRKPVETPIWKRLFTNNSKATPIAGLYLYGCVGRGKTFLMDLYCDNTQFTTCRLHYHEFMQSIHEKLRQLNIENPLDEIARNFAEKYQILCLDEFMVTDITDAMLLYGLLSAFMENGIVVITTTNIAPDDLYKNGLQRERFLPAIALIKSDFHIHAIGKGQDYRRLSVQKSRRFFVPDNDKSQEQLNEIAKQINHGLTVESGGKILINNRPINTIMRSEEMLWCDFNSLCEGPRSQRDYLSIAKQYAIVIVSHVPVMAVDNEEAAKRFLLLIDVLYDARILLFLSAAKPIETIYQGKKLAFEFQRVQSRLAHMQQPDYASELKTS